MFFDNFGAFLDWWNFFKTDILFRISMSNFFANLHHNLILIFIWFFRVMSRKFREIPCDRPFSGQTNSFPAVLILQMLSPSMNSNFFKKNLARGARARNYEPWKNEHFFRVLQKVAATKKLFCRNVENGKKKYLDWQKFL